MAVMLCTHYVVTKQLGQSMDAVLLTAYRFFIAALPLYIYIIFTKRDPLKNLKPGIILGFFLWLVFVLIAKGVNYTTASNAGFISGIFFVFVPFAIYFVFKKTPKLSHIFVITLSLCGLYLLTGQLQAINIGDWMILLSAIATSIHLVFVGKYAKEQLDPIVLCFQQFTVVFLLSFIFTTIFSNHNLLISANQVQPLLFLGLFPTLSVFLIQMISLKYVSEITASLILSIQPALAAVFAVWFGRESLTTTQMFGGGLLILSAIIYQLFISDFPKKNLDYGEK